MIKNVLIGFLCLLFLTEMTAQSAPCGVSFEDQLQLKQELLNNRTAFEGQTANRNVVTYVPIKFHILGDDNGNGYIRESNVLDALCNLNQQYDGTDIQFYMKDDFNYLDNNVAYMDPRSFNAQLTFPSEKDPAAANLFIPLNAEFNNSGGGTTLGYYWPPEDYMVVRKANMNGNPNENTVPHEFGHFFGLMHTFFGWERTCSDELGYCEAEHGLSVNMVSPNGVDVEYQDGRNGDSAADMMPDTPPDYLFGLRASGCTYNGNAQDPSDTPVDPMENNFMSYFDNCSQYVFTPNQITSMQQNLSSSGRAHLNTNFTPISTEITEQPNLDPPSSQNTQPGGTTSVDFSWSAVDGANKYMIQIARNPGFTIQLQQRITTATSETFDGFTVGSGTFYWRVKGYNEYYTCQDFVADTFEPGVNVSVTNHIKELNDWAVNPTVASELSNVQLSVSANNPFDAQVSLLDVSGRALWQSNWTVNAGEQNFVLPSIDLTQGVYIVSMQTETGIATKKVIIQ